MSRNINNVNVVVIGGAGFLGSHLVDHLIEDRNCNVIVLDNLISGSKKFINKKAKFIYCDITQSESVLYKIFKDNNIDYVFNYAAEPYIPVSFERPLHTFNINAFGALKVMNAAQEAGVKGILQVSSAEIYGDAKGKINEEEPVRPHSTYGAAKAVIDSLVQIRWKEAKTPAIAMRQFNCLGENETHPYIIPEIINQISKGGLGISWEEQKSLRNMITVKDWEKEPDVVIELGNNSFRDFQYAGDAVRMAVELLEKGNFGEVYNIGSQEGIKMYDLAFKIGELMGKKVSIFTNQSRVRPWEIWHLQSDNTKLYKTIDYRPRVSLEESLKRVIKDYNANGFCF